MADNRSLWPAPMALVLLVPAAVLVTVLTWAVQIYLAIAHLGSHESVAFEVVWGWRDTVTTILAYALLLGAVIIRRAAKRPNQI